MLEVETPILAQAGSTDPNLISFQTHAHVPGGHAAGKILYLHTSPEFAMKRLLAAGSGSIFQICKAFRDEEIGRFHNPEFTMLEWYRVGFDLQQLIAEVDTLVRSLFVGNRELHSSEVFSYGELFERVTGLDPILADCPSLNQCARRFGLTEARDLCGEDKTIWLDFLFSHLVQPNLGNGRMTFVIDYPAILPSLARVKPEDPRLVERVEVFLGGMELANGFRELDDAPEQDRRFESDLAKRQLLGMPIPRKDERLISALASGMPGCSGIALGVDRLLMLMSGARSINEVLAFPIDRA